MFRLEDVENPLLQTSQMCGFSPVCVLMCRLSRLGRSKAFPQIAHGSIVFSLALRPGVAPVAEEIGRAVAEEEDWRRMAVAERGPEAAAAAATGEPTS